MWILAVVVLSGMILAAVAGGNGAFAAEAQLGAKAVLDQLESPQGICAILEDRPTDLAIKLARASELLIYVQLPEAKDVAAARKVASDAGLLNRRIFIEQGKGRTHLADNLADLVVLRGGEGRVSQKEALRILRPGGKCVAGSKTLVKPAPQGLDAWSHPYHGPDNNPQSADKVIRHPYLTQFLGYPMFGCISEVTVGAGGKIYKAFGHTAFKTAQNEVLNKLYCINAHNGAILWTRPLKKGFMIHRNTMIATPDALYLADDESCKLIDPKSGQVMDEIIPPKEKTGGIVWKWMALQDGVLYALIGGEEVKAQVRRATQPGFGHWPWGMWPGYDYQGGAKAYGFGRSFVAFDLKTDKRKLLWHHREEELLDSRGTCMKDGRIYYYCPDKFLACLNAADGKPVWKTSDAKLLAAIGPQGRAQHYTHGFSTSAYVKCSGKHLFFAGPQRPNLAAVSCKDGSLAWVEKDGNFQLVLRDDALYAIGAQKGASFKRDYDTGKVLAQWPGRRACTRATGTLDSIFYRASGGTIRFAPANKAVEHIAPMRPPCHDGVIVSEGMLYWGPWICGCQLSLYGNIGLAPAGDFNFNRKADEKEQLQTGPGDPLKVAELKGPPARSGKSTTCGGMVFTATRDGAVTATGAGDKKAIWTAHTGGGVNFPPAVWNGRVFVGSNDGCVYAFEAKTGRLLWRFRAAPAQRLIPVYGKLMSTWPVAGGVVVRDGILYAAAGIAHYDGTHVYALDAATGKIKWHNNTSGALAPCKNGISLQGELQLAGNKLTFCGGNAYPRAEFDLATGKCLTAPHGPNGVAASTFYEVESYMEKVRQREKRRGE